MLEEPSYQGTQYLWFQDLILDVVDNSLFEATPDLVKRIGFAKKQQIQAEYNGQQENIHPLFDLPYLASDSFKKHMPDVKFMWTPERFLLAYASDSQGNSQQLLFYLALGLFNQHNFQGNLVLTSKNRPAKYFLQSVFKQIYGRYFKTITQKQLPELLAGKINLSNTTLLWLKLDSLLPLIKTQFDFTKLPQMYVEIPKVTAKIWPKQQTANLKTASPAYLLPYLTPKTTPRDLHVKMQAFVQDEAALSWTLGQSLKAYEHYALNLAAMHDLTDFNDAVFKY